MPFISKINDSIEKSDLYIPPNRVLMIGIPLASVEILVIFWFVAFVKKVTKNRSLGPANSLRATLECSPACAPVLPLHSELEFKISLINIGGKNNLYFLTIMI